MNSSGRFNHVVIIGHSRRWGKTLSTEFRKCATKLIAGAERHLKYRFQRVAIRPVFFPPVRSSSADETLNTVAEASFAILDVTDSDEELAFLAGALTARGIPTLLFADAGYSPRIDRWPYDAELVRYQTTEELETKIEIVSTELGRVLETTPVPPRFIHTLWFPRDVSSIWIVCPQIADPGEFAQPSSPDYTYLDNLGDTDSLLEVMVFLSRYYSAANIEKFSSRDLPIGLTKGNLVVIGGPGTQDTIYNELAGSMMEAQHSRVSYSDDCESMIVPGDPTEDTVLRAKLTTDAATTGDRLNLVVDFGYFARFRNPANESNYVVCLNGIHTIGVLGAARAFGDSREALRNYQTALAEMSGTPEFECYFEVNVLNRDVRVPRIEPAKMFPFGMDALPREEIQTITDEAPVEKKPVPAQSEPDSAKRMLQGNRGRLKVVNVLARQISKTHGKLFEGTSGILLLHALEDLPPFLEAFESLGLSPSECLFYYKRYPYLNKDKTLKWLGDRGYQTEPMEELNNTLPNFLQRIDSSGRIFVLEDGGYIGPFLHQYNGTPWDRIVGAVEQTERGVRMYEQIPKLRLPVAPVARCGLKNRQEPPHVGRTIVSNIQRLLPDRNLSGMRCLVIGYGRIGMAVCNAARGFGMNVSVYDSNHGVLTEAAQESFNTSDNLCALLADAQIVIGTTGNESLGRDHILSLKHNAILVSGSSGQYEIGLDALDILSRDQRSIDVGTEYTLEKENRVILLLGDGYPINFVGGDSVPDEAIDPILGALLVATIAMVENRPGEDGIQLEWTNKVMAGLELEKLYYDLYFS